jgi:hypothetical protein
MLKQRRMGRDIKWDPSVIPVRMIADELVTNRIAGGNVNISVWFSDESADLSAHSMWEHIDELCTSVHSLSPLSIGTRGYTLTFFSPDGKEFMTVKYDACESPLQTNPSKL